MIDDAVRGHDLILAAARRIGGAERLRALTAIHYSLEGDAFNGLQGYDPANLESAVKSGSLLVAVDSDYTNHRHRRRIFQLLSGGIRLDAVTYFKDGQIADAYPGTERMNKSSGDEAALLDQVGRDNPVIVAKRALEHISTAMFVGQQADANELVDIVELSWSADVRVRVHLTASDHRISAVELAGVDPLVGDDDVSYAFGGERVVSGLSFPERVTLIRRHQLSYSANVDEVVVNHAPAATLFDAPPFRPLDAERSTRALGHNAYEITGFDGGTFRVLFFDLGDGIVVFDAPASRTRSESVANDIRKAVGDKPIKYLVLSHFHDDHIRGIGYYIDRGVQIVTTRANASIVTRYATVNSRLREDLPATGRPPSFVFVDDTRLALRGAGGSRLDVYKLADCPHTKDMLVAYEPAGRLLAQADLFVELAPYSPTSAAFAAWMNTPSAPAVDWIVGTHLATISRTTFDDAGRASGPH